jgi:A/G-specific adenine glycosylase
MPASAEVAEIRRRLLEWYESNRRDFPWRRTRHPYAVLVSEVMLQQTQASRVVDRFERFMARFPTAEALATASSADVLAEWSGLGYNRRALALQRAAAMVCRDGWPSDITGLRRLPGVGPYTARAVVSLAFGVPAGVVDTNVRRWLLRRFGDADAPAALQARADALAAPGAGPSVAAWTHASMEFGAAVCRSGSPACRTCPIADGCPSRGVEAPVPVPRQPPLRGSDRALRGAMLRQLTQATGHALSEASARQRIGAAVDDQRWERILAGLERDGLLHRRTGTVALGAATIGR